MAVKFSGIGVLFLFTCVFWSAECYTSSSGIAKTTRYWDCCKPTCAWRSNAGAVNNPVRTCAAGGRRTLDENTQSGCNGGSSFVCNNQRPFVKGGQAYAFAAANVNGLPTSSLCCACYKLTFSDTALAGKSLIVQVTNTGSDLGNNHFDLMMPAGGEGIFTQGCPKQWPAYPNSVWGDQYGGISYRNQCDALPSKLVNGCRFRFDWFKAANNPHAKFERIACPSILSSISHCKRSDD
ncbi:endo-beta-1,4-glucanase variant 1 [Frankliniella occidentalis]|uniref:Cellulase n=1 Tax=Frankliniella occidentalis TaxID=133901 RepID=A0A6J1T6M2_FRAOC|nr:endoglucanase isoform X2 [Frankliniella occidentalis]XP_052121480.1 endoglucanase isoform X1 [Frankliniella occidentalis]XP_052121481.1 endoglucanase isoform X3 [Frankliniella occidentalis]KAE8749133.1 endo-beta-1,4-glucanase variant 2 [Frankliniella occidentalis]KAE8749134.1 endo-beta-1,4-glucanase variant 1 [Frankliniella occidentalis]